MVDKLHFALKLALTKELFVSAFCLPYLCTINALIKVKR